MTTGTTTRDNSYFESVVGPNGNYNIQLGSYQTKTWVGGDQTPSTLRRPVRKVLEWLPIPVAAVPRRAVGFRWVTRFRDGVSYRWKKVIYAAAKPAKIKLVPRYRKPLTPLVAKEKLRVNHAYSMSSSFWLAGRGTQVTEYEPPSLQPPTVLQISGRSVGITGSDRSSWDSNVELRLIDKLRLKIAGSDFNMGVFLAEGAQSLSLIVDSATRISKTVSALKKGRPAQAWSYLSKGPMPQSVKTGKKAAANNWIEMQYGWFPLVSDMEAGAQALAAMVIKQSVSRVKVQVRRDFPMVEEAPNWIGSTTASRQRQIIAYITKVDVPQLLGLTDVASVLWEKTPWSFVADWVVPIGSFLSARGLAAALTAEYVISDFQRTSAIGRRKIPGRFEFGERTTVDAYYAAGTVIMERTVTTELPIPLPSVKSFAKVASWQHAANAVALLQQKLSK